MLTRFVFLCPIFFSSLALAVPVISTSTPFAGVTRYDVTDTVPRVIHYELIQIDTKAAGISFGLTPSNGAASLDTNTSTTLNYVASTGAALGINAGYFTPVGSSTADLVSLEVSAGSQVSPWIGDGDTRSSGINISSSNVVTFFRPVSYTVADYGSSPSLSLYNAVGSNYMSVKNNVKTGITDDASDFARTSIGVKGQYLYLFTIDNSSSSSLGMTPVEVGALLHDTWGLTDVLNLDGGGSTQMAMNTSRGATYINTPESASNPRKVAGNLVVFAASTSAVNILDDFETTDSSSSLSKSPLGHFISSITASGSNTNIASTSSYSRVTTQHHTGSGALELTINDSSTAAGFSLRFLSGAAQTAANVVINSSGYLGYWLKTSIAHLTTAPVIADGSGSILEVGSYQSLTADGQWHLYQWNLNNAAQWDNFFQGNGSIDAAGVTLDSLMFQSSTPENAVIDLDDLQWTASGTIPIPEPSSFGLMVLCAVPFWRKR